MPLVVKLQPHAHTARSLPQDPHSFSGLQPQGRLRQMSPGPQGHPVAAGGESEPRVGLSHCCTHPADTVGSKRSSKPKHHPLEPQFSMCSRSPDQGSQQ